MGGYMLRFLPLFLASLSLADKNSDLITSLPGLTFTPTFKQYSGYLNATQGNLLHYWLVEAQTNPQLAPLVLWLNGGPGCSSLGGFFTELGPFHPAPGGQTLVENVHSWNKVANVLFLEAPHGVGFSYRDNKTYGPDVKYNDDKTATDNALALKTFFSMYPEYQGRDFYITGESYGGVYVPTLTNLVIQMIQNGTMPGVKLVGMAVGNGELSSYQQINSAIDLLYFRGMLGKPQFDSLKSCCTDRFNMSLTYCDFSQFVEVDAHGNLIPLQNGTQTTNWCAQQVVNYAQNAVWDSTNDVYNSYQDCYNYNGSSQASKRTWKHVMGSKTMRTMAMVGGNAAVMTQLTNSFQDYGAVLNVNSTDAEQSFPCYMDDSTEFYLNRPDVRAALHIPDIVPYWTDCNIPINEQFYEQQHHDMTPIFNSIIQSNYSLRILIYNGDVDMACNFQGDEWFIYALANGTNMMNMTTRIEWIYTRSGFDPIVAGFTQQFTLPNRLDFKIDLLTVKGGGHFVPTDRPGPALQMISNFLRNGNYNDTISFSITPQPMLPQFVAAQPNQMTRKQADRIWNLPGLTYNINFRQYSGYLNGVTGNYLHYWLIESQGNPLTDPLVLWLNGGPGCSSLMGLLSELGPFHPNADGKTLYENQYAWNKGANMLFIESPRNVGFSVQDKNLNNDTVYNDQKTAWDVYLALKDFFTVYPEYAKRPFYVTGESYGGVYVPTLTSLLIDEIQGGRFPQLNLIGMAVGNGELSAIQQINSIIHMLYFHGLYGKQEWDNLQQCCNASTTDPKWFEYCDFTRYIYLNSSGDANPIDGSGVCDRLVVSMGYERVWNTINDVYNIYQDCYQQTKDVFGSVSISNIKASYKKMLFAQSFVDQGSQVSDISTDNQGGFACYSTDAAAQYLNSNDVRTALHISSLAGNWSSCNDDINSNYVQQHNDTGKVFDHIVSSGYPLRMMIYNGDVDMACNFLGDQWFIESVAKRWNMQVTNDFKDWRYMTQIAGYAKKFSYPSGTIDLLTVKGAGHLVPTDRPGPALQMFTNFIRNQDFSNPAPYNTQTVPLMKQYVVAQQAGIANGQNSTAPQMEEEKKVKVPGIRKFIKKRKLLRQKGILAETSKRTKREVAAAVSPPGAGTKDGDKITNLPGLTFNVAFSQYSGYLQASPGNWLHYWLVESQGDPKNDPLILWLNGGPGCSSLGGFFEELGPFHVNPDGQTLFENVYSWNKVGNVLFLEAPRDVGFSYRSNDVQADSNYNDTYTADDNVLALDSFFNRFPEYKNRSFFITGESYGGVYVPTLTDALIKKIQNGTMSYVNLTGVGIGNGEMSEIMQINSAVSLLYWRGERGKTQYDALNKCCNGTGKPLTYCDWSQYYYLDTAGNAWPKETGNSLNAQCGQLVVDQGFNDVWGTDNDVYNTFQDCYSTTNGQANLPHKRRVKRGVLQPLTNSMPFVDQNSKVNTMSTDANQGFSCYNGDATQAYLNLPDVRTAIHIPPGVGNWTDCNDGMNENYVQMHNDTTSVFESILNSGYKLRFLIYNGDADMACQFLGDEWFIENLATRNNMAVSQLRRSWNFTEAQGYHPQIGGYYKSFNYKQGQVTFDLLTVKGGGHFVPTDRPGPALQMLQNFVNKQEYSSGLSLPIARKPLMATYTTAAPKISRKEADMVFNLPGLTYQPNFHQHSGYLQASAGNYLHYWLVESQNDPRNDPLILWLNGGPGCSSLGGLFVENGPFHPNPDGQTLFENVYSWNKGANVLYMESPRLVGFSYQATNINGNQNWNDDMTTSDAVLALKDFFATYPQFMSSRFYVTGESYAGVYIPALVNALINEIKNKTMNINLVGMAIGNGMVSSIQDIRSLPDFLYYHGIYGKQDWDALHKCCPTDNNTQLYCDFEYYVNIKDNGDVVAKNFPTNSFNQNCAYLVETMAYDRNWMAGYDVYNLYQDCYTKINGSYSPPGRMSQDFLSYNGRVHLRRQMAAQMRGMANPSQLDPFSTDNFGGFQCFMTDATTLYLRQSHVRDALHVPDFVQDFDLCANINYTLQYNDTTDLFESIINSGYKLDILIYNGDTDTACSMFEAEWFIEELAQYNGFKVSADRSAWTYANNIAGYTKTFVDKLNDTKITIYLNTVKGAGHMVPTDRPGPALQLITNFVSKTDNFNNTIPYDLTRAPLLPQFTQSGQQPAVPETTASTMGVKTTQQATQQATQQTTQQTTPSSMKTNPPIVTTTIGASSITSTFFAIVLSFLLR